MTFQHIRPHDVELRAKRAKYETQETAALLDVLTDRPFRFCLYEGTDHEAWILWQDSDAVHHTVWRRDMGRWMPAAPD